jgi:hypothetical protein
MKIDLSEYEIVENKSVYNNNYYIHKRSNTNTALHEICHEDENYSEFYLVDEISEMFLGCSSEYCGDSINIDFGLRYT